MRRILSGLAIVLGMTSGAAAQDSLGLNMANAWLSVDQASGGGRTPVTIAGANADFAITDRHGFQLDVDYANFDGWRLGTLGGHLYMLPRTGRKYGVFVSYGDVDNVSASGWQAGIEGMFDLGQHDVLIGQAGLGIYTPGNVDFIFGYGGLNHTLNDRFAVDAGVFLVKVDEIAFSGTAYDAAFGISYSPRHSPLRMNAAVTATGMRGTGHEIGLHMGISISFGNAGGAIRPLTKRSFARHDAISLLARLGRL